MDQDGVDLIADKQSMPMCVVSAIENGLRLWMKYWILGTTHRPPLYNNLLMESRVCLARLLFR
jgi:hypothetical protein